MDKGRVCITGLGPVTPVGIGKDKFWDSVVNGRSNYTPITRFDTSKYKTKIAAQVQNSNLEEIVHKKTLRRINQFGVKHGGLSLVYAVAAADLALKDSGIELEKEDKKTIGVLVGAATGDIALLKGINKPNFQITQYAATGSPAGCIAFQYDLRGPSHAVSGACATGNLNLQAGLEKILSGRADVMLVGSTSALIVAPNFYDDYSAAGSPMTRDNAPMKPFDKNRSGFILGEGAGVIVLEDLDHALRRGAHIYAEIIGYGESTDTSMHFADVTVDGYTNCLQNALHHSQLTSNELSEKVIYLNAHGTGTRKNDEVEMQAVRNVFAEHAGQLLISSIKGTIGHPQEAASAMELIASALVLDRGVVPPSTNIQELDPKFEGLNIVRDKSVSKSVDMVVKNASGFCGVYSTVILGKYSGR